MTISTNLNTEKEIKKEKEVQEIGFIFPSPRIRLEELQKENCTLTIKRLSIESLLKSIKERIKNNEAMQIEIINESKMDLLTIMTCEDIVI